MTAGREKSGVTLLGNGWVDEPSSLIPGRAIPNAPRSLFRGRP